jgi:septal ring factor EnvC (AmiA/AmiB activator)
MGEGNTLKRFYASVFSFLFFGLLVLPLSAQKSNPPPSSANVSQVKKKIHKSKKDLEAIEQKLNEEKIKKHQDEIKEKQVLGRLQKVDQALEKLRREKEANQEDLHETRIRVNQLRDEMTLNQQQLTQSRELMKRRLRALYRMSVRRPFLGGLLDADSFSDLARKLKFEMLLALSNEKLLNQTLQTEERLEEESGQWNDNEHRENRILLVLGKQETNYSHERRNRTSFLTSIERQKEVRERTIEELTQAAQDLQEKVAGLLQQEESAKHQQVGWVSAGQGLMVKRGKIPWPVSGKIIQPFGKYRNPEFKEFLDNSGIQIQAPEGTPFRAVAAGRVGYADWLKGYGKLVILDHGQGYYSIYSQAAELDVSKGDEVKAGQVLGTVGDTGSLVGTSLYFEIRKNGVPQDPALWLKRR